jgi:hypothetical protein
MRKRSLILVLIAIPAWTLYLWLYYGISGTPFGSELGSVAFPVPPIMKAAAMIALLSTMIGFALVLFDFMQWIKRRAQ